MSESKKLFFLPTSIYPKATKKLWFHRQISFLVFSTLPTVQRGDDHNVVDHHVVSAEQPVQRGERASVGERDERPQQLHTSGT